MRGQGSVTWHLIGCRWSPALSVSTSPVLVTPLVTWHWHHSSHWSQPALRWSEARVSAPWTSRPWTRCHSPGTRSTGWSGTRSRRSRSSRRSMTRSTTRLQVKVIICCDIQYEDHSSQSRDFVQDATVLRNVWVSLTWWTSSQEPSCGTWGWEKLTWAQVSSAGREMSWRRWGLSSVTRWSRGRWRWSERRSSGSRSFRDRRRRSEDRRLWRNRSWRKRERPWQHYPLHHPLNLPPLHHHHQDGQKPPHLTPEAASVARPKVNLSLARLEDPPQTSSQISLQFMGPSLRSLTEGNIESCIVFSPIEYCLSGTNTPTPPTLSQATAGPEAEVTTAESPRALLICRLEILNKVLINVKCFMTNIVCDGGCWVLKRGPHEAWRPWHTCDTSINQCLFCILQLAKLQTLLLNNNGRQTRFRNLYSRGTR